MKAEEILHAHELDILFDGRQKDYGAYMLRLHYELRLRKAVLTVMAGALALSILTMVYNRKKPSGRYEGLPETRLVQIMHQPVTEKKTDIKKPSQPKAFKPARTQAFNRNIQIVASPLATNPIRNLNDSIDIDTRTVDLPAAGPRITGVPVTPGTAVPGSLTPPEPPSVSGPLETAEVMPEFPGGIPALRKFLENNLQTPASVESGEAVSVSIRFVVGEDGKLKNFETVKDGGEECNREVVRVLRKMPDWKPGRSAGRDVSVYFVLPVTFARQE